MYTIFGNFLVTHIFTFPLDSYWHNKCEGWVATKKVRVTKYTGDIRLRGVQIQRKKISIRYDNSYVCIEGGLLRELEGVFGTVEHKKW